MTYLSEAKEFQMSNVKGGKNNNRLSFKYVLVFNPFKKLNVKMDP